MCEVVVEVVVGSKVVDVSVLEVANGVVKTLVEVVAAVVMAVVAVVVVVVEVVVVTVVVVTAIVIVDDDVAVVCDPVVDTGQDASKQGTTSERFPQSLPPNDAA